VDLKYILHQFPLLNQDNFRITSPVTTSYNCIAWAAEDNSRFWWPAKYYWPPGVRKEATLEAFVDAFKTLGFEKCDSGEHEDGHIKVALYVNPADGRPTHAARELPSKKWTSKLGPQHDIEHDTPELLCGTLYGMVAQFMKRPSTK
jgi:hypothetical protein